MSASISKLEKEKKITEDFDNKMKNTISEVKKNNEVFIANAKKEIKDFKEEADRKIKEANENRGITPEPKKEFGEFEFKGRKVTLANIASAASIMLCVVFIFRIAAATYREGTLTVPNDTVLPGFNDIPPHL
jgi:predicted RND superfamily exporter protein